MVYGAISVFVNFKGVKHQLEFVVVRTEAPAHPGRLLMAAFPKLSTWMLNVSNVNSITSIYFNRSVFVKYLSDEFYDLFTPGLT